MQRPQRRVTAPRPLGFTTWRAVAGLPKCFEGKGQNEVISDGQRAPARTARTTQGGFRVWGCELGTPTVYVIKDPTLVDEVRPQESCEKVMVADVEIKITLQEEVLHCSVEQSCILHGVVPPNASVWVEVKLHFENVVCRGTTLR